MSIPQTGRVQAGSEGVLGDKTMHAVLNSWHNFSLAASSSQSSVWGLCLCMLPSASFLLPGLLISNPRSFISQSCDLGQAA